MEQHIRIAVTFLNEKSYFLTYTKEKQWFLQTTGFVSVMAEQRSTGYVAFWRSLSLQRVVSVQQLCSYIAKRTIVLLLLYNLIFQPR